MKIWDSVYGDIDISEKVLLELINSPSLKRLQKISQCGLPQKYNSVKTYSRFEHSLGVMCLLHRLKAPLTEQIVGLLHDVSHLAFSHVAEWVISNEEGEKQDLNEKLTKKFVLESEVADILQKYGYDPEKITDLLNFPLVRAKAPKVTADNLDYSLRDINYWFDKNISSVLKSVEIENEKIVFLDQQTALFFAKSFIKLQKDFYGSFDNTMRYYILSNTLKYAVKKDLLKMDDFYGVEGPIIDILEKSEDKFIKEQIKLLQAKYFDGKPLFNKRIKKRFYHIDPDVKVGRRTARLTDIYPEYKDKLESERRVYERGIVI